jgi:hypothetical protein
MATQNNLPQELERLANERKDPVLLAASREIAALREERARLQDQVQRQSLTRRFDAWLNGAGE